MSLRIYLASLVIAAVALPASSAFAQSVRVIEWSHGKSTIAVLFIHGLGGCAVPSDQNADAFCANGTQDSFRIAKGKASWPEIAAADSNVIARDALRGLYPGVLHLNDLGTWGVDYSTLTAGTCPQFSIPNLAATIRSQLEASELFEQYEQVIIVAHSLGGLITKNMLLEWRNEGDDRGFLRRVIGVFLLGVPSQGSGMVPEPGAMNYIMDKVGLARLVNVCRQQAKDLFAGNDNTYLQDLEQRWTKLLGSIRAKSRSQAPLVYCARETMEEPLVNAPFSNTPLVSKTIVDAIYAQTQCSDAQSAIGTYPNKETWRSPESRGNLFRDSCKCIFIFQIEYIIVRR
ncbi:pimeloyl-ACP methyl ester carboxylesterase [Bradyrhizobium diazoefficiens]